MRIAVFHDPAFKAMPTYTAADAAAALRTADHDAATVDAAGLARLDRRQADVLVLPYVDGTFSEAALAGMVGFHAAGGGLVVLGDLPHQGPWYPLRNMQGDRLGEIMDLTINAEHGCIAYVVLSFGGFLGLGDKYFAIPWGAFSRASSNGPSKKPGWPEPMTSTASPSRVATTMR